MKKVLIVAGTRPNFIKITQFKKIALKYSSLKIKIVHTGQHYDNNMVQVFFEQFNLLPDYFLDISLSSSVAQIAGIMVKLEELITKTYYPDLIIVAGDVNSTLAAALTANKMHIKLAHLESGLRSFDKTMPEEFNRIITDTLSDYFFVTEQSGIHNLKNEGANEKNIFFTGNTMIDTLVAFEDKIQADTVCEQFNVSKNNFVLMTMHRPSNVDTADGIKKLIKLIDFITLKRKLIFPVHPRTVKRLNEFNLYNTLAQNTNLILCEPLGYFSFQKLIAECFFILTDSGGIQEEATFRKRPCITIRSNTERPSTTDTGTNTLAEWNFELIKNTIEQIANNTYKKGNIPPLWDGHSTERIVEIISRL